MYYSHWPHYIRILLYHWSLISFNSVQYLDTFFFFFFFNFIKCKILVSRFNNSRNTPFSNVYWFLFKKNLISTVVVSPFLFSIVAAEYTVEYSLLTICNTSAESVLWKTEHVFSRAVQHRRCIHIFYHLRKKTVALGVFLYLFPRSEIRTELYRKYDGAGRSFFFPRVKWKNCSIKN